MNPPGGDITPAGGMCTHCATGSIEVIVWKHGICWDTPEQAAQDAKDPRFPQVTVRLNELSDNITVQPDGSVQEVSTYLDQQTTQSDGRVVFDNLLPSRHFNGLYKLTAHFENFEDVTEEYIGDSARQKVLQGSQVSPARWAEVVEHDVAKVDLVMRRRLARLTPNGKWTPGRECHRRHARKLGGRAGTDTLGRIFWDKEPTLLSARDALWVVFGAAAILVAALGFINSAMLMVSIAAICAAFFGYFTGLIFGEVEGTVAIIVAAALFGALLVATVLAKVFGIPSDPYGVAVLAGIWAAFAFGYCPGRRDVWRNQDRTLGLPNAYYWLSALMAAVAAGLILGLILIVNGTATLWSIAGVIVTMVLAAFAGGFSGWIGFAFANEGRTRMPFGATDYKLPYLGERYCLQGIRGYWSHFDGGERSTGEGSYDWAMAGDAVLSAKEGHLVAFYDDETPDQNPRGDTANYAAVRHRDGSIARYVHLKPEVISTAPFPRDLAAATGTTQPHDWRFEAAAVSPSVSLNPLHVYPGNRLGSTECRCSSPGGTDGESRWPAFWIGTLWAVAFFVLVLVVGYTAWNGEPPRVMYVNSPADWFSKLWTTSDSAYSYGWSGIKILEVLDQLSHNNTGGDVPQNLDELVHRTDNVPQNLRTKLATLLEEVQSGSAVDQNLVTSARSDTDGMSQSDGMPPGLKSQPACTAHPYKFDRKYCECLDFGGVKQFGNTYSDIGFLLFGIFGLLLLFALWGPNNYRYVNRMTYSSKYTLTYGIVIISMGPGSMLFHIGFAASGGLGDGLSMYMFGGFLLAYAIIRLAGATLRRLVDAEFGWFLLLFFSIVVVCMAVNIVLMQKLDTADFTTLIMLFLVPPGVILTLVSAFVYPHDSTGWMWFALGIVAFGLAFFVWGLSQDGNALCHPGWAIFSPESWFQGHGLWHILSAAGVCCVYWFLHYEKDLRSCEGMPHLHFAVSAAPPPGPPLDVQNVRETGTPVPAIYKPVKFADTSLAIMEARPWSFRKAISQSQNLGLPALPPDLALFRPDNGVHAPAVAFEGTDRPTWYDPEQQIALGMPTAPLAMPDVPSASPPSATGMMASSATPNGSNSMAPLGAPAPNPIQPA